MSESKLDLPLLDLQSCCVATRANEDFARVPVALYGERCSSEARILGNATGVRLSVLQQRLVRIKAAERGQK